MPDYDALVASSDAGRGYRVFISHAHEDSAHARRLAELLRDRAVDVWLDTEYLRPGDDLKRRILRRSRAGIR